MLPAGVLEAAKHAHLSDPDAARRVAEVMACCSQQRRAPHNSGLRSRLQTIAYC